MALPQRGPDQIVKIVRAEEKDIAKAATRIAPRPLVADTGPLRVQAWWKNELVFIKPLTIKDGVVEDLMFTPKEAIRFDRLVFMYGGRGFKYSPGQTVVEANQPLHLALNHLKLNDRFGNNIL